MTLQLKWIKCAFLLMFILFDYYLITLEEIMKHLEGQQYADTLSHVSTSFPSWQSRGLNAWLK